MSLTRRTLTIFFLLCATLPSYGQSGGKTINELFSDIEVSKKIKLLADQCWEYRNSNPDSALLLGKQAIDLAVKHNVREEFPRLNGYVGVVYLHYLHDIKESTPYLHHAMEYSFEQKDTVQLAYAYNNLGDLYLLTGNTPLSLKYSKQSLELFEKLNHSAGKSYSYANMGLACRANKEFDLSIYYFELAKDAWRDLGDEYGVGSVLLEMARTYDAQGNYDVAMSYYQKSYNKTIGLTSVRYAAFCVDGMAGIYYYRNKYDKAFEYYDKALRLNKNRNYKYGQIDNYIGLALVYAQKNNKVDGEAALFKAQELAQALGLNVKILEVQQAYAKFYQILKDFTKALECYNRYYHQYDSIFSLQQFEIINEMQNGFTIQQTLSNTEQELENGKIKELYLLVILLLLLVIAVVFYWQYQSHKKLNRQLSEINRTKDKLFSVISHDLKNPFNSLIGFSELLKEEVERGDLDNIKRFSGYLNQASHEGMKLLTSLLDWSRSQSGKITFSPSALKLEDVYSDLNEFFEQERHRYGITIDFITLVKEEIIIDPDIIRTVLMNLISNAIKYTNENGVIHVEASKLNDVIQIRVRDNGTGMSNEVLSNLFNEEEQMISTPGLRNEQGTGLGLSICAELIRIHNGKIRVESELGKGSLFEIEIPFITEKEEK